jgi:hypothetical protein
MYIGKCPADLHPEQLNNIRNEKKKKTPINEKPIKN